MKKILFTLLFSLLLLPAIMQAQVPDGFNFQAVIRNEYGALAANQVVTMKISITTDANGSNVIYTENHSARTNSQGLITLIVGQGSNPSSSFSDINWGDGSKFVKVEADVNGGFDFRLVSVSQILSVPYALAAHTAEKVTGNVDYNQIVGVPDPEEGFSGDYNDLTNKPELFSGDYNDLTGKPRLFSGSYSDLIGKPVFADSVRRYSFSGSYNDLEDKPVLFSGSYNDLTDVPTFQGGFSGNYADLIGAPAFRSDSLPVWNQLLDYRLLQNKPVISADGSFSGNYNDLTDKPDIDAIASNAAMFVVGNLRYGDLNNLPSFPDSVARYSDRVDYRKVSNLPNMKDTVEKYAVSTGGTLDYNALENKPNFADSVSRYSFSGNYNQLTNRPNIKDTISQFGFSGRYEDLEGRPMGTNHGELLYWNKNSNSWETISPGHSGYILVANTEGVPQWTNPAYVMRNIQNTKFCKVKVNNYPIANATITDELGLMQDSILEVPVLEDVNISVMTENTVGVKNITVNGEPNFYVEKGNGFISFTTSDTITEYIIDVTLESDTVYFVHQYIYELETGDSIVEVIDSVVVGYGKSLTYGFVSREGFGYSEYSVVGSEKYSSITENPYGITLNDIIGDSIVVTIKYRQGLYTLGELYTENGVVKGIVFEVSNKGKSAKVVSIESLISNVTYQWNTSTNLYTDLGTRDLDDGSRNQSKGVNNGNPIFRNANLYGTGYYLPAINELVSFNEALPYIKDKLTAQGVNVNNIGQVWSSTEEFNNSAYFAYLYDFNISAIFGIDKVAYAKVIYIKTINKN